MDKEQEELLSIAHMNYVDETQFSSDPTWFKAVPCMDRMRGELKIGYRQYAKEEFIDQCKTNTEFSEKWGLKIEERELSFNERYELCKEKTNKNPLKYSDENGNYPEHIQKPVLKLMESENIPTKLITITYNDKTIESYE
jgi:hypothetical protein